MNRKTLTKCDLCDNYKKLVINCIICNLMSCEFCKNLNITCYKCLSPMCDECSYDKKCKSCNKNVCNECEELVLCDYCNQKIFLCGNYYCNKNYFINCKNCDCNVCNECKFKNICFRKCKKCWNIELNNNNFTIDIPKSNIKNYVSAFFQRYNNL